MFAKGETGYKRNVFGVFFFVISIRIRLPAKKEIDGNGIFLFFCFFWTVMIMLIFI